jgi:hypothetical protein
VANRGGASQVILSFVLLKTIILTTLFCSCFQGCRPGSALFLESWVRIRFKVKSVIQIRIIIKIQEL